MTRKILSMILAVIMIASVCVLASCGGSNTNDTTKTTGATDGTGTTGTGTSDSKVVFDDDFKLGVILLHDEASTYDLNFINGVKEAQAALGLKDSQIIMKRNIGENEQCYEAATELVAEGCKVIFADSFSHESYMIRAAKEFPEVQFCHATGTMAHTENLPNFHNAFASIYEGRYLAGVAAGLKLKEMDAAGKITDANKEDGKVLIGYVGAFTYAEVMSGYTSFYLGVKSEFENVKMYVQFTGSWYDENEERNAANALIAKGCALISQHADSMGAPSACEDKGIPNVSYNGSTKEACPDTFIVSSRINWAPYFKYICEQTQNKQEIVDDFVGTLKDGSVVLTEVNEKAAAAGTADRLAAVKAELENGTRHVFDASKFTVGGANITSYKADVDTDAAFEADTEAVENGIFYESKHRSAPYFNIRIDDIVLVNEKF